MNSDCSSQVSSRHEAFITYWHGAGPADQRHAISAYPSRASPYRLRVTHIRG